MEAAKTLALIRNMRHDFGNHLQIINGYFELGYLDEVKVYIMQIVNEMSQERALFELNSPELSLFLLQERLLVRDLGVILKYDVVDIVSVDEFMDKFNFVPAVQSIIGQQQYNEADLHVSIHELEDQIKIVFSLGLLADDFRTFEIKKAKHQTKE